MTIKRDIAVPAAPLTVGATEMALMPLCGPQFEWIKGVNND